MIELVGKSPITGAPGIGHTRWATPRRAECDQRPSARRRSWRVVVVAERYVENYLELKAQLQAKGVVFKSVTDTETIVHLLELHLADGLDLVTAARKVFAQIQGANVIVLMSADEPDKIITARNRQRGRRSARPRRKRNFIASDTPAIMEHTRKVMFLESRQMAVVTSKLGDGDDAGRRSRATCRAHHRMDPVAAKKASIGISCRRKFMNRYAR